MAAMRYFGVRFSSYLEPMFTADSVAHRRTSPWWLLLVLLALAPVTAAQHSTASAGVEVLAPLVMPGLDRVRTVRVYLPPGYAQSRRRYPVLYVHDGQNLFDDATAFAGEWGIDESLDALAKSDGLELIVVGIDNGGEHRIHELSPWTNPKYGDSEGTAYLDFVVRTVKPLIDRRYRTRRSRAHTGILGSSLGALSSHHAIYQYPEVFSKAGLFSPSYWYSAEIAEFTAARSLPEDTRIYLVVGDREGDEPMRTVADVRRVGNLLRADATEMELEVRAGGEHNEAFWRREFPAAVRFLFGKR